MLSEDISGGKGSCCSVGFKLSAITFLIWSDPRATWSLLLWAERLSFLIEDSLVSESTSSVQPPIMGADFIFSLEIECGQWRNPGAKGGLALTRLVTQNISPPKTSV